MEGKRGAMHDLYVLERGEPPGQRGEWQTTRKFLFDLPCDCSAFGAPRLPWNSPGMTNGLQSGGTYRQPWLGRGNPAISPRLWCQDQAFRFLPSYVISP